MYGEAKAGRSDIPAYTEGIVKQPEHYEIATKMAQEIVDRFEPMQQNEMLKHIHGYVKEQRTNQMRSLQEKLEFLDKTLSEIK